MLKPSVQVMDADGILVAEFWDCLRLDPAPVKDLRQHFEAHMKAGGRPDLVIDMLGVAFAGSASLGGFMALHRLVGPKGGRIVFCNVDETVYEVFRISKLSPMFGFVADRPAALESLRSGATAEPKATPAPPAPAEPPAPRAAGPLGRRRKPS
ncbi:STAS domain-containing protein [Tundrisphaera sp. TA3]|uniref:STAS domain-containing protein n=1 Tax=Tundrisphaera sp. TA3 TaxID=3435775 RepID=UPI003EBFBC48